MQTNSEDYLDFARDKIEKLDQITCKSLKKIWQYFRLPYINIFLLACFVFTGI